MALGSLTNMSLRVDAVDVLAVLAAIVGFVTTLLWLFIGWRAMRAHERIASAIEAQLEEPKTR